MPQLTGIEFETWLMDPRWARLPDFLDFPEFTLGDRLIKSDIVTLRALARGPVKGNHLPYNFKEALRRLHTHGIIGRLDREDVVLYHMTPYSYDVLLHNVSYREGAPPHEQRVV